MLMLTACRGLSSEPEIDLIIPSVPTQTRETFEQVADIEQGAQIFLENCVQCHGIRGAGDGQLVQTGQVSMTTDFTNPTITQNISLRNWFETISNGRLYALMPPWKDALTVDERWAVALYSYSLSYSPESITKGSQAYLQNCATCHGEIGAGGATAPSLLGLLDYNDSRLSDKLASHQTELALSPSLSTNDLIDLSHYLRLLSTSNRNLADSIDRDVFSNANTASTISGTVGRISGHLRLGTAGATLPDDLVVTLSVYDKQLNTQITENPVNGDGSYQFEDVELRSDLAYLISVNYEGWRFLSDVVVADPKQKDSVMNVTLYESTDDSSVIEVTSRITQVNLIADALYVEETINLRNSADKMLIRELSNESIDFASIEIPLPAHAQIQSSATDMKRFRLNQAGNLLLDSYPVIPDQAHIIRFAYILPFSDEITITQPVNYKINGSLQIYVEDPLLTLHSGQMQALGNQQVDGFNYRVYEVLDKPEIGQNISVEIIKPVLQVQQSQGIIPRERLALGLLVMGLVLTVIGIFLLLWNHRSSSASSQTTAEIIQQIVALDKQYEAGKIAQSTYQSQRDALKAKIADRAKLDL